MTMANSSKKDLMESNFEGLIPGPAESDQSFAERVAYCLNLNSQITQELSQEFPFAVEESPRSANILKEGCQEIQKLYDIFPTWVPLFFSNYKLLPWHGGCTWIFQQTDDYPAYPFLQLRKNLQNSTHYGKFYTRKELIAHELSHIGRMRFEEPIFEEILAYRSSPSRFRRFFGPIIQTSTESLIFVFLLVLVVALDILTLEQESKTFFYLSRLGQLFLISSLLYALIRLYFRQYQFKVALKNLHQLVLNKTAADAIIYRLTDAEIIDFSRLSPKEIYAYAFERKDSSLRWTLIYKAYLSKHRLSDHYDGYLYHNNPPTKRSFKDFIYWMWESKPRKWPESIPISQLAKPLTQINDDHLRLTFVNHATILIQWGNINILTDPIWSKRCSPFSWVGPKRVHSPGICFEDLPPIHLVLLSHNHYDHMDIPTLRQIQAQHHPKFITGLGNKNYLKKKGLKDIDELDWWEAIKANNFEIIFTPARHFSMRNLFNKNKTLWGGFIIRKDLEWIYFAGDTGYAQVFEKIKARFGSPRISLLPIGAYEPRWFMEPFHMSPSDAVQAHIDLASKKSIAIHFGTFRLSDEAIDDPEKQLKMALKFYRLAEEDFIVLKPGKTYQG
jgi:L-ascorbate metabolism protein UlaG (beta-lactamase superfamily)